jgi:hypothetical protein
MGPVAAVNDAALVLKFSQTAFPVIVPPAERIRVTTVASIFGVQFVKVSVPTRQGTPATQMLSLIQNDLSFKRLDSGDL